MNFPIKNMFNKHDPHTMPEQQSSSGLNCGQLCPSSELLTDDVESPAMRRRRENRAEPGGHGDALVETKQLGRNLTRGRGTSSPRRRLRPSRPSGRSHRMRPGHCS